jgi:hypothetical protein
MIADSPLLKQHRRRPSASPNRPREHKCSAQSSFSLPLLSQQALLQEAVGTVVVDAVAVDTLPAIT